MKKNKLVIGASALLITECFAHKTGYQHRHGGGGGNGNGNNAPEIDAGGMAVILAIILSAYAIYHYGRKK